MKSPEALRVTLMSRLSAARGLLRGHGHKDSALAIEEAQEVIRALPYAEDINAALYNRESREYAEPMLIGNLDELRVLRTWHYDQYVDLSTRANEMQKKSDSRTFAADSRNEFEKVANAFRDKANRHLRFVRVLNDFFPASDRVT